MRPFDGLRGVAIAMVVAFHMGFSWATGGFVGVDVFFVLSGYLITGLLVTEVTASGRLDLRRFWGRRARRLLPALCLLLVVLVVVAAADPHLVSPSALRVDGLATLFYVQNWHLALQSHRAQVAQIFAPSPLLQTWSLAVEEQFYLIWPLVVLAVVAVVGRHSIRRLSRALGIVIAIGVVASASAMAAMSLAGWAPLPIYYDSGARAFELLLGGGLALLLPPGTPAIGRRTGDPTASGQARPWARTVPPPTAGSRIVGHARGRAGPAARWVAGTVAAAALAGLCWFAVAVPGVDPTWLYRGGLVAAAAAAAVVIGALAVAPTTPIGRLLATPPLVALGRISYGVYLWHWPVLVLETTATTGLRGPVLPLVQAATTLAVSGASWVIVERPLRRVPARGALRRMVTPVVASGAACLAVGALVVPATTPATVPASAPVGATTPAAPPAPAPTPTPAPRAASATTAVSATAVR